ncbi:PREDICTED: dynein heavy chain 6, axonemal-like [Acropora digitifera]|uniref:dynein heavy chain 6, axonemal-like n=1 Tax=Acropora digitifera TaxID=70779 RepID=UPI00077B1385|nr:PREDICTED: dynein heavy chain 6, axonemal-like [Acropora digitifera]
MAQNGASTFANGRRKPANNDGFSLPGIDENELRARIYAKPQLKPNPRALKFRGPTPVQLKKNVPTAPKLEPLPNLARYQEKQRNLPYTSPAGKTKSPTPPQSSEPDKKKTRRRDVVEPLERTTSPLPDLPDELKSKQEKIDSMGQTSINFLTGSQRQFSTKQRVTQFAEPAVIGSASTPPQKTDAVPEGLTDPLQIISLIRGNPKLGFLYMTPAVEKSSILYNPYNLKIVKHSEINHSDYYTISTEGVTHLRDNEAEFTALERWEKEHKDYKRLVKIPTFANFRMWKAFVVWRKNVKTKKITQCKNQLQENLFIVNSSLRPALLNVREMCYRISDMGLCKVEKGHTYTLDEFRNAQFEQLEEVAGRLAEFRDLVKEVVRSACRTALLEAGFTPDDYFMDMESPMGMYAAPLVGYDMDIYGDAPDKMTYTEQANKRSHCKRLTSFIRLADYLIVNTMHVLAANSVATLLNYLEEQLQHTPTPAQIQGTHEENKVDENKPERDGVDQKQEEQGELHPLYTTELLVEPQALLFFPGLEDFQDGLGEVVKKFQDAVLSVHNLVPDPYFDVFTQPFINGKIEEKTAGDGPSLATMFEDDRHLQGIIQRIKDAISSAFDAAWQYANTFEPYRQFYQENESLDLESIRQGEHGVSFFSESLEKYNSEHEQAVAILKHRPIGMILVDCNKLKEVLIPSPLKCLEVIHDILPKLAKLRTDTLMEFCKDAQFKLEVIPSSTVEYVESLTFLDKIQEKVDDIERDATVVKELYDLIETYKVPTPPEDLAVYQHIRPTVTAVRNVIDKSLAERDADIDKMCTHIDKDIVALGKEVKEVKQKAQDPKILDSSSQSKVIIQYLSGLLEKMETLNNLALTYKTHQKNFKVEVAKFEELEEVYAELKLKQSLWNSLVEWDVVDGEWLETSFEELNPETLSNEVMKYAKTVMQLEKGLPPNSVVPILKEKVEEMRRKLPVITNLRNPALKPRHWEHIQQIFGYHFTEEEPLTLGLLNKIDAFDHTEAIEEVSGQASSEASLEGILKKVEDSWKQTEFIVLPHRDSKDVFILGGIDDIQALLDDSMINISTIAGSRHVGPIRPRVEDWQRQLHLFSETLDEWMTCQRNWLYLESIFSAPDIQRQLPAEAKMFLTVDKSWKEVMRKVHRLPNALRAATQPGLLEVFQNNNALLDQIQKCLEAYLESKCVIFPRFYFLSNDELLEILSQTRNPHAVQPHLQKCFDAISKLEFGTAAQPPATPQAGAEKPLSPTGDRPSSASKAAETKTNDILAMISPEGERVGLSKDRCYLCLMGALQLDLGGAPAGPAGTGKTETTKDLAKALAKQCVVFNCSEGLDFKMMGRFFSGLAQSGAWCCFDEFNRIDIEVLSVIAQQLLTIRNAKVAKASRFMFEGREIKLIPSCAAFITMNPGYAGRTELPDNLKALFRPMAMMVPDYALIAEVILYSEGFESSKNLARKMVQMYRLCSEQLSQQDHYDFGMRAVKSVLVMAGALKRGNPNLNEDIVLIRALRDSNLPKFLKQDAELFRAILSDLFPGKEIPEHDYGKLQATIEDCLLKRGLQVVPSMVKKIIQLYETMIVRHGVMTVGPTGGGKTTSYEILKDTLTTLFEEGEDNAYYQKVQTFVLNPKAVSMGELYGEINKLTMEWRDGLMAITVRVCVQDTSEHHKWIVCDGPVDALWIENMNTVLDDNKMLCLANSERIKLNNTMHMLFEVQDLAVASPATVSRCGMVYMDPSALGWRPYVKSWLERTCKKMKDETKLPGSGDLFSYFVDFDTRRLEPWEKIIPSFKYSADIPYFDLLVPTVDTVRYGFMMEKLLAINRSVMFTGTTGVGKSVVAKGLLTDISEKANYVPIMMNFSAQTSSQRTQEMIEVKLEKKRKNILGAPAGKRMIIFVDDLNMPKLDTYGAQPPIELLRQYQDFRGFYDREKLFWKEIHDMTICAACAPPGGGRNPVTPRFLRHFSMFSIPSSAEHTLKHIFKSIVTGFLIDFPQDVRNCADAIVGASVEIYERMSTDLLPTPAKSHYVFNLRDLSKCIQGVLQADSGVIRDLPGSGDLFSYFVDFDTRRLEPWEKIIPSFKYSADIPYFDLLVPTVDTVRYGFMMEKLLAINRSVMFTGTTGVGKSVVAKGLLTDISEKANYVPIMMNFSAQTSSQRTQEMIEVKLEKKRKNILGAPAGKRMIIFVDDLNMPKLDTYGAQPPIELLRQYQDFRGFYDREKLFWKEIHDMTICAACAPPGGGRNPVTPRFLRHFSMFSIPSSAEHTLKHIFKSIVTGFLVDFPQDVRNCADAIVGASVEIYERMSTDLLPTPAKSHYVFNLRDLSKCIQGVLQADSGVIRDGSQIFRLFCHEAQRVFHDRLINKEDKRYFNTILSEMAQKHFSQNVEAEKFETTPILFGDFMKMGADPGDRIYEDLVDITKVKTLLADYLDDYNMNSSKEMKLVFFMDAIEHVSRIARMVRQPRGNALLVGVGGTGKQSLTRLACHMSGYLCFQIELTRGYDYSAFREDLKKLYMSAGVQGKNTVFLFTDTQIVVEEFLEDINNILNSGEVPNLFEPEEYEQVLNGTRPFAKEAGVPEGDRDAVFNYFISRVRNNLHVVLCMSPVGDAFRTRCRMFPSLVNCCTIDWFTEWPRLVQYLNSVRTYFQVFSVLTFQDNIPDAMLKKLKKYIDNPKFTPENVEKVSKACRSMVMWVRAMDLYARVFRTVEPKKKRLAAAQVELDAVMATLKEKQDSLAAVEAKIAELQASYDNSITEKETLTKNIAQTAARLKRASKLTTALGDEQERWTENVAAFELEIGNVVGNVFVAAACVAYFGAFTSLYRHELISSWIQRCKELEIPVSDDFSLINVLADAFEIRQWNADGLPRDSVSIENAILVTRGRRWPLMIDPQDQANRWIRAKEAKNGLKVIKLTDQNFLRTLENCIRIGMPVLLEEVGETLDPALEPILLKQTFVQGGRLLIRLGDSDIDYDKNFKFYMTTKLANPHYLPEVCIKVTIINFTVTKSGLEDQLLRISFADWKLFNTCIENSEKTDDLDKRLEILLKNCTNAVYTNVARGLFEKDKLVFSFMLCGEIMRQKGDISDNEWNFFLRGSGSLDKERPPKPDVSWLTEHTWHTCCDLEDFLPAFAGLKEEIVSKPVIVKIGSVEVNGLFEKDKLVFSFMLCGEIMRQKGDISDNEWNFFLRGSGSLDKERPPKPDVSWLTEHTWHTCCDLEDFLPAFAGLKEEIVSKPVIVKIGSVEACPNPALLSESNSDDGRTTATSESTEAAAEEGDESPVSFGERLTSFQSLIFVKAFREEKVVFASVDFVCENLGKTFVESPSIDLNTLYADVGPTTPLIFILSTGSDPMNAFLRFAREMSYSERIQAISLGQGQGPVAEKMIANATKTGDWIFLQNCHLAASWMLAMETLIKHLSTPEAEVHEDFRLFLSSMPTKSFPVTVLQNSVKVTNEPPKGLRANAKRAFGELSTDTFENHILGVTWRKLVFGICFFHAIIQERKKFGPLGWNIKYEFNDSDRESALDNLKMFLAEGHIPWDALTFITGQITYGGRVTDAWDQRCLTTILERFFAPSILEEGYKFSSSGIYFPPGFNGLPDYRDYIDSLPIADEPEIFGMHNNANIAFQTQETNALITAVLEVQPRLASGGSGKTSDEIVYELAESILSKLPAALDMEKADKAIFETDVKGRVNSLTTVLGQEVDRFNSLLKVIKNSLQQLQKAIKGLVVMSLELDKVYTNFLNNQVPSMWSNAAYPSLKPLGSWVKDLLLRCLFIEQWIEFGAPKSFWISGFFYPQGFLTGTLQNHARRYNLPIDQLSFHFNVLPHYRNQEEVSEARTKIDPDQTLPMDSEIESPYDGVLVHGLFLDAARWNDDKMMLGDARDGEMNPHCPILHMEPRMNYVPDSSLYTSPLYKTSERAGVLSTTGHSTNFVVAVYLPTDLPSNFWIEKGTALLCQLNE